MPSGAGEFKVVLRGVQGVGKSALTVRMVTDNFFDPGDGPNNDEHYRMRVRVDGRTDYLEIVDYQGEDAPSGFSLRERDDGQGFLLVYDITQADSLAWVAGIYRGICERTGVDSVAAVVVGNKCDLGGARQVTAEQGAAVARELGLPWMESSAKAKINVQECFEELVRVIWRSEEVVPEPPPPPPPLPPVPEITLYDALELYRAFDAVDTNQDGRVDAEELARVLRALRLYAAVAQVDALIAEADLDGDGVVDRSEVYALIRRKQAELDPLAPERDTFQTLDMDQNGYLSLPEVKHYIDNLRRFTAPPISEEDLSEQLALYDLNGDGFISFEEFLAIFES